MYKHLERYFTSFELNFLAICFGEVTTISSLFSLKLIIAIQPSLLQEKIRESSFDIANLVICPE